jgi:type VI secretion system protein ImpC
MPTVNSRSSDVPFRIAVLGDFSGRANRRVPRRGSRLAGVKSRLIDPDNFEEVMQALGVELLLSAGSAPLPIAFRELDDFHPDQLYRDLPLFQAFRQTRAQLSNPQSFRAAAQRLRPDPPPPVTSGNLLDQIAEQTPERVATDESVWGDVIRKIVSPHLVAKPDPRQEELIAQLDAATSAQMRVLLHHPDFQAIEAAWRSIFLLLRNLETGTSLKIYLMDVTKEELAADALSEGDFRSTGLHRLLVDEAAGSPGGDPWSVVAGLYTFEPGQRDGEVLARIAAIARAAGAPFLAAMDPILFGCESIAATPDPDDWKTPLDVSRMQAWHQLRQNPNAEWLGLAMPRFLLRLPYGKSTTPIESFDFEEMPEPAHDSYVWGNPAIACACLLGEAFQSQSFVNRLDEVPLHVYEAGGDTVAKPPAEIWLTERFAGKILDEGIMPLASVKNSESAQLVRFQSIAQPPRPLAGPW